MFREIYSSYVVRESGEWSSARKCELRECEMKEEFDCKLLIDEKCIRNISKSDL